MTAEEIDKRIKTYEREAEILGAKHRNTVDQYQQMITNNQNRFQQIQGAITELQFLRKQMNGATNEQRPV